eukprot:scaffold67126_cov26-Tisochrysis_lutea.AAC.1
MDSASPLEIMDHVRCSFHCSAGMERIGLATAVDGSPPWFPANLDPYCCPHPRQQPLASHRRWPRSAMTWASPSAALRTWPWWSTHISLAAPTACS